MGWTWGWRRGPQSGRGRGSGEGIRAVLRQKQEKKRVRHDIDVHGNALCVVVQPWARHKITGTVSNNGRRLAAVGGGWWRLAVGGPEWLALIEGCP